MNIPLQETSQEIWEKKYQLKDNQGNAIDKDVNDNYVRVAEAIAGVEKHAKNYWQREFQWALENGATPAGRIMSNAGAGEHKPATSLINCTVSKRINDSIHDVLISNLEAGLTLKAGCGIGYEFSTLRPKGAYVAGAGAYTSGALSFMDILDATCFTISSAGGRRGAQMATFAIWHPDVLDFIKAKREDGRFRQFNCSLLITDEFMEAVTNEQDWDLVFPVKGSSQEIIDDPDGLVFKDLGWSKEHCTEEDYMIKKESDGTFLVLCKVYKTIPAKELWDTIMRSTYDFAEPGFIMIDKVNKMNNNWFCENIRATNPCGMH